MMGCAPGQPLHTRTVLDQLARTAAAQRASASTGPLTLDEDRAVALALVGNPTLRAFRLERGVAEGEVLAAGAIANPELRLEVTHLQNRKLSELGWGVGLEWAPPQPAVRTARRAAAEAHREEIEHAIREREWALASDVRASFAGLVGADERARLTGAALKVRDELRAAIESRVGRGAATRFDADLSALALAEAQRLVDQSVLSRAQAERALAAAIGLEPDTKIALPPSAASAEPPALAPATCAELQDKVIEHPALAQAAAHVVMADDLARVEHAARWPWFKFMAVPRVRRNEFFGHETDFVVGVNVLLPLFDWNTGRIRAAEAARDRARAELTADADGIRREVAGACTDLGARADLLRLERERLAPVLEQHDRLMRQALSAHEVDLTTLLVTETRVLDSRLELARAQLALRLAWINLERASGRRLPGEARP
jgi:cobalt-zinc-cadmium efflux system outer membrane protein